MCNDEQFCEYYIDIIETSYVQSKSQLKIKANTPQEAQKIALQLRSSALNKVIEKPVLKNIRTVAYLTEGADRQTDSLIFVPGHPWLLQV